MNRVAFRFENQLKRLDQIVFDVSRTNDNYEKEIKLSFLIIKLHDQWNFRSRQIILTNFGRSEISMVEYLRRNWSSRRYMDIGWEPDWHIPSTTIRAARLLNIPDLYQIQNSIGAVTYIDDIRWTRNAIVHNIPSAFTKYKKMIQSKYILTNIIPFQLPLERNRHTGNIIYQDWCEELKIALQNAL